MVCTYVYVLRYVCTYILIFIHTVCLCVLLALRFMLKRFICSSIWLRVYGKYVCMLLYVHGTCFSHVLVLLQPHNIDIHTYVPSCNI